MIIGAGMTGLSAGYHLKKGGLDRFVVLSDGQAGASRKAAGLLLGGLMDQYTRIEHAYGGQIAKEMWAFGDSCLGQLALFSKDLKSVKKLARLRLIVSKEELAEAQVATSAMQKAGFDTALLTRKDQAAPWEHLGQRVLAIHREGVGAYLADTGEILEKLASPIKEKVMTGHNIRLVIRKDGALVLGDNLEISCHMVLLASHCGIKRLLPSLEPILIPYGDQWLDLQPDFQENPPDMAFSAHHGYEWGAAAPGRLLLGGGRFLRKHAGIGESAPLVEPKVTQYLQNQLKKTFVHLKNAKVKSAQALAGLRPCDELPIIGPMFTHSQILLSTGYMGSGLAMGFAGGKAISELILTGRCTWLPDKLHPRRLRTLEL